MKGTDRPDSTRAIRIALPDGGGVEGLINRPDGATAALILAHGAGAGMRHPFMEATAVRLAHRGVATLRYQFPYMEAGRKRPDSPTIAQATVRAAVHAAAGELPGLPLFAGGKSFGGRMTSQAAAASPLPEVRGLVFLGFPLHPSGRPAVDRADHLGDVSVPMLFLQGTRDRLADLELLRPMVDRLGTRATLRILDGADHSFHVLKRSGRTDEEVLDELAAATADWISRRAPDG